MYFKHCLLEFHFTHKPLFNFQVEFNDFSIESHTNCRYDYVEIFNGPYTSSPSIGRFCGNTLPPAFRSQSNALRIVMFTDYSQADRGFRLSYTFVTQGIVLFNWLNKVMSHKFVTQVFSITFVTQGIVLYIFCTRYCC